MFFWRLGVVASLTLGGLCACGPDEVQVRTLIEKAALEQPRVFGDAQVPVRLVLEERALRVEGPQGEVLQTHALSAHLDIMRCYDGCGRTCTILNNTDRAWQTRDYIEVESLSALTASLLPQIEVVQGEFCRD